MADSDGEYVGDMSDDDHNGDGSYGTRSKGPRGTKRAADGTKGKNRAGKAAWEDVQRSWEHVLETADGTLNDDFLDAEKRRRLLRDTTALQRGIIRHLMLVLDMSFAMADKDLLPNRYNVTLNYAIDFVREYFEQNPISQMGIIAMRDGVAIRVSDMSGNPTDHIDNLRRSLEEQEPLGNPSLQNALEMCRGTLFHLPSHGTREILIVYGALMTSDPGDMQKTIENLIADRIRVSIIGLAAQVAICAEITARTNETSDPANPYYTIATGEAHFRELLLKATTPPLSRESDKSTASLLMMGFPSRTVAPSADALVLCACHNQPTATTYACTRCRTRVCRLPAECPACGLMLVLSTHLARSYHHLFPLRSWVEVSWADARRSVACYACQTLFPTAPPSSNKASRGGVSGGKSAAVPPTTARSKGVSESGRYACPVCEKHFCIDCDVFSHEVIHNCPGCQSEPKGEAAEAEGGGSGETPAAGRMDVD
ncbi:putative tfiih basal transcription factor complex p47 subunit protein [Podospora conica]|nr:putative tfiih basal transcription factor complex p47 subunit protein [Schizothecium conicum]